MGERNSIPEAKKYEFPEETFAGFTAGWRCGDDLYVKNINKWWDGHSKEKFVLISDVEPGHKDNMGYFLKIWADRYPFLAEIKGSSMQIRPQNAIVTSNYKIEQIWAGNLFVAIWRRFHKIYKIEDKIVVYKREIHQPSDQYVSYLRDLLNLSENYVQEKDVLEQPPEMVQGTSKAPTLAEKEGLHAKTDSEDDFSSPKKKTIR